MTAIRNVRAATRRPSRRRAERIGVGVGIALILLLAAAGPALSPYDPLQGTEAVLGPVSPAHPLGTDYLGRDVLSRLLAGAPASVFGALAVSTIALVTGVVPGVLSVYLGRVFEWASLRLVDTVIALPFLIVAVAVCALLGNGLLQALVVVGVLLAPVFYRVARAVTISVTDSPYLEAARLLGVGPVRAVLEHVWPKVLPAVAVAYASSVGVGLTVVSSLTFLGIGVQPPAPTWGGLLAADLDYLTTQPWAPVFPIIVIVVTVWLFNYAADLIRDGALDHDVVAEADAEGSVTR